MWLNLLNTLLVIFVLSVYVEAHSHSHEEPPPHYKYSKEANEKVNLEQKHGHSHDHGHDHHGHSHDHGHDHHGHSHDHGHDHHGHSHDDHGHSHNDEKQNNKKEWTNSKLDPASSGYMLWLEALGATALISAAPVIILFFIPLDNSKEREQTLKLGLSFASGGLLGDAFLHLIPHAIDPHDHSSGGDSHSHSHSHDAMHSHSHHIQVGLCILSGIMTFLIVEKFVHYVKGNSHSHGGSQASNDHSQSDTKSDKKSKKNSKKPKKDIAVSGYLNLAADFAHNFTDGLTIGASFLVGRTVGMVTMVAILLHEVPHEIGDFAILIQAGMSKKRAMMVQLVTALGAMMGTVASLLAEGIGNVATNWILPFTAGGFIYIATVSVLPQLLEDSRPWQSFKEIFCLLLGVSLMIVIAMFE